MKILSFSQPFLHILRFRRDLEINNGADWKKNIQSSKGIIMMAWSLPKKNRSLKSLRNSKPKNPFNPDSQSITRLANWGEVPG